MVKNNTVKKKETHIGKKQDRNFLIVMLAIPVLSWIVFWLITNLTSFIIAFQDTTGNFSFVNFELFWDSLTENDGYLAVSAINTLKYFAVSSFVIFPLTICVCYFFFKQIAGYKVFRIIFYLPAIISAVVFTGVFKSMIANNGPLGLIFSQLGVELPQSGWLGTPDTATNTIIVYSIWTGICGNMLLVSGAMARIPVEVLEAAKLDGAKIRHELFSLVLPLIWPTLSTILLISMSGLLLASGPVLLLQPLPSMKTGTISYWLFDMVYAGGSVGAGKYSLVSAAGLCFTLVLLPITLFARWLMEKVPTVEY